MKTSIATVSLSGGLGEKLEAIAAAGFAGVEIFENDLLSFDGTAKEIGAAIRALGLEALTFQPFRDFEGMPEPQRARALARAERKFDTMQELGCDLLLVCSNVSPDSLGGVDRAADDFRELGERAARRGLRIGFEALAWGRHISDYRDAWEVVRRTDHKAVGLVLDTFHIGARRTDLAAMRAIPRERIFLVQVADAPRLEMDVLSWSRHFRCFPGQGDLDLASFMAALLATGYDGPLSLEVFNDQFRAGSARDVAVDGQRSLLNLLDQVTARTPAPPSAASIARLPARSRCLGVEFLEFAVDDRSGAELERLLAGLGFRLAGRHRSKAVTRWRQGAINLVINREQEGFAHAHQVMHGSSVCAMALRVADAPATLARAERLLAKPFRQPVAPGELEIPAIRGLGGSLLYFVDPASRLGDLWSVDFAPTEASGPDPVAALTVIDHVSQSMQYEEMLSWLLFYTSLFEVAKTPELDVADPGGLVRSQVIETDDGALRVVLNGSQSQRTQSSRFLTEFFGSGVQHVAFATDDLVGKVRALRAAGVPLLPIPDNYYDDLEARSGLPAERLDVLRENGILWDRDGEGEFLQAYTRSFEQLFFFELVERRGGYRGFGAPNAPIRLAAQARLAPAAERAGLAT